MTEHNGEPWVASDTGPFSLVPAWVIDARIVVNEATGADRPLSDRAIRLYCVLARFADSKNECWPRRKVLSERIGCSLDSLDRAMDELREVGAVTVQERYDEGGQRSNLYLLWRQAPEWGNRTSAATPPQDSGDPSATVRLPPGQDSGSPLGTGAAQNENQENKNQENETSSLREAAKRRSRIPNDFAVTDAMREWAAEKCPHLDLDAHTERFVDYWRGEGKPKLDWVATWRNWMSREAERPQSTRAANGMSVAQAWEKVVVALQRGKRPTFDDRTETIIGQLGGWTQMRSSNVDVLRGHFMKFWQAS